VEVLRLFPHAILKDQATTPKGEKKEEPDVRRALDGRAQGDSDQTCFQQERKYRPPKKGGEMPEERKLMKSIARFIYADPRRPR
jgi:hypothetical protein